MISSQTRGTLDQRGDNSEIGVMFNYLTIVSSKLINIVVYEMIYSQLKAQKLLCATKCG